MPQAEPFTAPARAAEERPVVSREEQARVEIGSTDVSRSVAGAMVGLFLLVVVSVPVAQHVHEIRATLDGRRAKALPQAYDIFYRAADAVRQFRETDGSLWRRGMSAGGELAREISSYEDALEDASIVSAAVLPKTQEILAGLGAGNEKAYVGRDGWLFFRPDIDYLTGPGFLESRVLHRRSLGADARHEPPQPDPVRAIVSFRDQLAQRGVQLIVMPTPIKASLEPEKFSARMNGSSRAVVRNSSFETFLATLAASGVLVFDPAPLLAEAKQTSGRAQYLESDTHWRPEAMELVARKLAAFVETAVSLPLQRSPNYQLEEVSVTNLGDIAVMLRLPSEQTLFRRETVSAHSVLGRNRNPWRADHSADVLLLGDSFSNIYSLSAMGWGEAGGLAEHLSAELGRPVDAILRNDNGSYATREILSRELARGRDRLAGKRVVIWQFAERELSIGDWKLLDLTPGTPSPRHFLSPPPGEAWEVEGMVEEISAAPRPGSVPYKDHIVAAHLVAVSRQPGDAADGDAVIYLWSMRDNVQTPAAHLRNGDTIRVRLRPWSDVAPELERINRSELADPALQMEEPCWAEMLDPR